MHQSVRSATRQRGVGLVEILIAVVVLSVGFLAAARMQVQGMRFSQGAYYRSQAYFLASDIIDRMRANPVGVSDGEYTPFTTAASLTDPECDTKFCSPAQMADQDLYDWSSYFHAPVDSTGFQATLPSSESVVANGNIALLGSGVYAITLTWSEQIGDEDTTQTLAINFAPEV